MYLIFTLAVVSFLISLGLTPVVRNLFTKWGIVDQPDKLRKLHERPIPRVGGIAIFVAYGTTFALLSLVHFTFWESSLVRDAIGKMVSLLPAVLVVFATGLLDDLIGLKPWQKLIAQVVAAYLAHGVGVEIHAFSPESAWAWCNPVLSILWLLWCSNAFNLIDGLDGLAAGIGLFATLTVLVAALTSNNMALMLVTVPLAGALLGFLRYNFNPASIFLGDCGSLLIGFLVGCFGVLWGQSSATLLGMTAPFMALSIPLLDATLSILRRFLRHQPIFGADRGHIHHRLLDLGLTPRRAALLMYGICCVAATLALLQSAFHNRFGGLIVILFSGAAWIGVQHLGYVEFGMAGQLFLKGAFRRIIDAQTRLNHFERQLRSAKTLDDCWEAILAGSRDFGFYGARMRLQGELFESPNQQPEDISWQLRVPLPEGGYINFQRNVRADIHPTVVSAFVNVVESCLKSRIERPEIPETRESEGPVRRLSDQVEKAVVAEVS
jgi:UDP-GlcNAc:undecaprenyl-phosphate/decaprenyl-phosphate GlcNAc-1-phosphate transferase